MATIAVTREEFQRTRARLTMLGEEVHDRASGILVDVTRLVDEVMDAVQTLIRRRIQRRILRRRFLLVVLLWTRSRLIDFLTGIVRIGWGDASAEAIVFCMIVWPIFEAFDPALVLYD